jgi:ubiquinone/menaquinone biosynthesis C-methylase UbiE
MENIRHITDYNRQAWDQQVTDLNRWTVPVDDYTIQKARKGQWEIVLTPLKAVPGTWFCKTGTEVLCLASGGGQQGPVLAAAGYHVTVFDISAKQLGQDRMMSEKHNLGIKTLQGDMADMSVFNANTFDMIVNPCSLGFVPDVLPVFREVARVLKPGGIFMTGFTNPVYYLFDVKLVEQGIFKLKYSQPYGDIFSLDKKELSMFTEKNEPLVFGHSLEAYLNGQLQAGSGRFDTD